MPSSDTQTPIHHKQAHPINPSAVSPQDLARALGLPESVIRRHLAQGAPTNTNGSVNLVHYAAWLNTPASPGSNPRHESGDQDTDRG